MTTDSFYAIGKSHLVCQDVARHGDGETPFIVVCDGCSGSPQTELGAQILAQTMTVECTRWTGYWQADGGGPQQLAIAALWEAARAVDRLHLHRSALDTTLMMAQRTDKAVEVRVWGDGAIMWRLRGGQRLLRTIEFKHGAPAYLSYHLDPARTAVYVQQTEDARRTISTYRDAGEGFSLIDSFDDTGMGPHSIGLRVDAVDLVLLASDGLGSFQRRIDSHFEAVPIREVADKAFAFKSMTGSFVVRRMRRFLTVDAPALPFTTCMCTWSRVSHGTACRCHGRRTCGSRAYTRTSRRLAGRWSASLKEIPSTPASSSSTGVSTLR